MGALNKSRAMVRFGDFELDQDAGELRRDRIKIRLQKQPLQILQILLEQLASYSSATNYENSFGLLTRTLISIMASTTLSNVYVKL